MLKKVINSLICFIISIPILGLNSIVETSNKELIIYIGGYNGDKGVTIEYSSDGKSINCIISNGLNIDSVCYNLRDTFKEIKRIKYINNIDTSEFVPSSLLDLGNLKRVQFRGFKLKREDKFINCESVEQLNFEWCDIPYLDSNLCEMPNLIDFSAFYSNLKEFPCKLIFSEKLKKLDLERCNLKEVPLCISEFSELEFLSLIGNEIETFPIENINRIKATIIFMSGNPVYEQLKKMEVRNPNGTLKVRGYH